MSDDFNLRVGKIVVKGCFERVYDTGKKVDTNFKATSVYRRLTTDIGTGGNSKHMALLLAKCNMTGWEEDNNGNYVFEYLYLTNPRSIYFMGMYLDLDTGYILMNYTQNTDSIILFNLYNFLGDLLPSFDRDLFKYNLEDLKLNSIGDKDDAIEVLGKLAINSVSNLSPSDSQGSICRNAINVTMDSRVQSNAQSKAATMDTTTMGLLITSFMADNMTVAKSFKRFMLQMYNSSRVSSENQPTKYGYSSYHYDFEDEEGMLGQLYYEYSNEENAVKNFIDTISAHVPSLQNIENYAWGNKLTNQDVNEYVGIWNSLPNRGKDRVSKKLIAEGVVYDKTSMDFEPKKIGKALKLYANLEELMRCSSNDEETEVYLTLAEEYDVAKKKIKKTSVADIMKGSYLTNVLKNKDDNKLYGKKELTQDYGFFGDLSNVGALNKKFFTMLRSVLRRI